MVSTPPSTAIKFLCSYGGRILPRCSDGKLRYCGGETRVLSVLRSVSFSELVLKLGEMCGTAVSLRCQLPAEDLDALVTVTSDEDLANLMEEYDCASPAAPLPALKIRAFLSPLKSAAGKTTIPPPSSTASSSKSSPSSSSPMTLRFPAAVKPLAATCPLCLEKSAAKIGNYGCYAHGNPSRVYLIHNGNDWQ